MSNDKEPIPRCPVCRQESSEKLGKRSDFSNILGYSQFVEDPYRFDREIFLCSCCGLQYIFPTYCLDEFQSLYDQANYSLLVGKVLGCKSIQSPATRCFIKKWTEHYKSVGVAKWKEKYFHNSKRAPRMLEIGCGQGWRLKVFSDMGFDPVGIDVSESELKFARANLPFTFIKSSFEDFKSRDKFDLILASHVIEHVADPRGFLEKIREMLEPNGLAVVETPLTYDFGKEAEKYGDIFHTLFFDSFTLTLLAGFCGFACHDSYQVLEVHPTDGGLKFNILATFTPAKASMNEISAPWIRTFKQGLLASKNDSITWARAIALNRRPWLKPYFRFRSNLRRFYYFLLLCLPARITQKIMRLRRLFK